ncbi:MAG: hypothetical protein IE922_04830 [Sphingomonadales bacterium]|nr:hypothetical protein [Sphingomonadales bacterium]
MARALTILARFGLFAPAADAVIDARFEALTTRRARLASRRRVSPFKFVAPRAA